MFLFSPFFLTFFYLFFFFFFRSCLTVEYNLAHISIDDGEDESWKINLEEEILITTYENCLVGCFLTTSVVHCQYMRNTLTNLWHSIGGVMITYLGKKILVSVLL